MCIIRLLAEDESRADREHRRIDLALLDAVTWPEFVWEWLRLVGACASCTLFFLPASLAYLPILLLRRRMALHAS